MAGLAALVESGRDEILRRWTYEAERAAAARGLTDVELSSSMADYVSALGGAGDELGRFSGRRRELIESRFLARLRQGYQLAEIVEEIALLGRVIASIWHALPERERPSQAEVQQLSDELHRATVGITDMFVEHMQQDEQRDKRYRRMLQQIASEALQEGAPPFATSRLTDALALIMHAMDAQSSVLLLYEAQQLKLDFAAGAGVADEQVERYGATLDPSTWAGRIAARDEATSILDATTTELTISEELRRSGIHSLLGVRLPPRYSLRGVLYVGLDTVRRFNAREIRRLEMLGEQLTLHLDNAKLYATLGEHIGALQSERELRERFVSVLAHDLRGPLAAAKLSATRLAQGFERSDKRATQAAKIEKNIDRADRMIRDLLDANRVRAGERLPLNIDRCDLSALAREVIDDLVQAHGPRFVLAGRDDVVGYWDCEELRRALWNLATNAVKYGAAGVAITIALDRTASRAELSVHNLGPAIPDEDQRHLFEPFARTQSARTGAQRGWGLGLTLVHGCSQAHGGRVRVQSSPEHGTTFTIELPLDARPFAEQRADVAPAQH